ncbi:hypothetical protein [Halobacillus litoralis]|nr:hypothetical protein [Halobacillus litoralis]
MANQKQKKKSPLVIVKEHFGTIPAKEAFERAFAPYFDQKKEHQKTS